MADAQTTISPARCPDCGSIGKDDCERVTCRWDQWHDGTRVTQKQRDDGRRFADAMNVLLAKRQPSQQPPIRGAINVEH